MEKGKGNRSVQSSLKGLGTESKKNQDVVNKLWPRGGRRREPNAGTFPKSDVARKPTIQQRHKVDKRPRPRGCYYSGAVGGKEDSGLEEVGEAELGSVFYQAPRDSLGLVHSKSGQRWSSNIKHKYNKEEFLQANCQFIVKESGDYKQFMNNPDVLVNWELIEQVNIHVLEFPSCPICLYPPVAAQMTRCGHIYCFSCMLHYLALSDKSCRKCPICYEAVNKNDLKSVVAISHATFNVNDNITFKLMKRLRGFLTPYPVEEMKDDALPYQNASYSKLLLAGKNEVMSIIERERAELQLQLVEDDNDCPEHCFVDQALALLLEREQSLFKTLDNTVLPFGTSLERDLFNGRERCESSSSDTLGSEDLNLSLHVEDGENLSIDGKPTLSKYFYFYQVADGQHIYLHALNVRMLEDTYGSLEFCPPIITGRIVEKESHSVTEELRKRRRYLQHLPVTCQFEVAEIQLKPPTVSNDTMENFYEQIEARRKRRQHRAREENRREKRITEEENKKMGKLPKPNIHIESHHHFPEFQSETVNSFPTIEEAELISPPIEKNSFHFDEDSSKNRQRHCLKQENYQEEKNTQSKELKYEQPSPKSEKSWSSIQAGTSFSGSLNAENEYSGLSFAKMLSSNKASSALWPARKSLITPNTPRQHKTSDSDVDAEGESSAPSFNQSFGDAIAIALEKAALDNDDEDMKMKGKKNKKNKQKKILFSTSMGYFGN